MSNIKIRPLTVLLLVLGVAFTIAGVLYFAKTAADLPSFLPGHLAHSTKHHVKHGMLAVSIGIAALIGAWVSTAPARQAE